MSGEPCWLLDEDMYCWLSQSDTAQRRTLLAYITTHGIMLTCSRSIVHLPSPLPPTPPYRWPGTSCFQTPMARDTITWRQLCFVIGSRFFFLPWMLVIGCKWISVAKLHLQLSLSRSFDLTDPEQNHKQPQSGEKRIRWPTFCAAVAPVATCKRSKKKHKALQWCYNFWVNRDYSYHFRKF